MTIDLTRRHLLAATALAASGLARPAIAQTSLRGSGSVVVYDGGGSMGAAQRKAFSEPFEAETGIKVIHQPGVNAGVQRAAILAGAPKHDVTNISGGALGAFDQDGLLLPLDYALWSEKDRAGFDVVAASRTYAPAMLYSMLIAYDEKRHAAQAPQSWADIWDVRTFPGKRTLAAGTNAADGATYEIALLADGVPPESLYPIDWPRALKSLDRLRADVVKFWSNGAESVQLQVDKQASLGSAWNGRIDGANDQGASIGKSWNQGILQWSAWAIPKGTANVENAQKYIAFMSRPEPQARFSELITYGPTNSLAFNHIPAERAKLLPTAPAVKGKQIVQDYTFWNATDGTGQTGLRRAVAEWERWVATR
ncbi:polyamine ABC transporter substrate-binding protein [Bradyrhizobium sp. 61]|uniref:polyamine ABC transporter substrate-binding protein n=1 Tax=unclassified Bradyrhizobium TaxID=2631580 RepID=UPI001FFB2BF2|nr:MULTISPECIES: polyamine ABC transporter substrate-binding protein [unclassified Bradyrhizobium]MCK1274676.1 polyamine ABC transporter substrate-binding protein [Bradyrhizobium sp. 61]MCK1441670.1 polyamine ABC transporter substrate-binding protein [Bradyrhizobium sp. 48]MCK1465212.1 polyamine ABC transporter substrate-binding protein [Bradyrhizobium sp. 2]